MNVLHVLPALNSGGVEQTVLDLSLGMRNEDWPVFVASSGGFLQPFLEKAGCVHETLPLSSKNPATLWRNALALENLIKKHKIHILHVHSRAPAWSCFWASKRCNIPMISTFHGVYNSHNSFKKYYNSVMVRGKLVIAISQFIAAHICKEYGRLASVITIPEGIDTAKFTPQAVNMALVQQFRQEWQAVDKQVILLPGRLTRWKGQWVLLEALRKLDYSQIQVVLLGDDQGRQAYVHELRQLAQGLPVHFAPPTHHMAEAYTAADYVVNCSTDPEAFGRVTAEAMATERVYIGTNHGATPEMCIHGETGFLAYPSDSAHLAKTLTTVLALTENQKNKITQHAGKHIRENFSLSHMVKQTLGLYMS
jgi:glycosyltransferase involved in cell wall biosynthesis